MSLDEWKKTAEIASPIITILAALIAFRAWRRELHGRSRFDVARKLLQAGMTLRDQVQTARSPLMGSEEYQSRPRQEVETQDRAQRNDFAYAYFKRMEKVYEELRALRLAALEATVFWYVEIPKLVQPLSSKVFELDAAANVYFVEPSPPPNREERIRFQRIMFAGGIDDVFAQDLNKGVHELEAFLRRWIGKG